MVNYLKHYLNRTVPTKDGCMEWTGCLNTDGYPRVTYKGSSNGKVHRLVYALSTGENIEGKVIRHKCDNPLCINPDHLLSGTNTDNMSDRDARQRHGAAKLTHDQVRAIRLLGSSFKNIELASMFHVNPRTISSILLGKHWKHVKALGG